MKLCPTCGSQWPDATKFCPNDGSTLRTAGTSNLLGSVIADRYHIEKKLGEGGMGAVYLGAHVKMGRKSAIKVMTQAMASDPEAIARFNREAANAARINHPNVCAIYDFGETKDGLIYLAMEFIEGESLSDLVEREGALNPKRAAAIIHQAGDALQAAHDLGIVHRDLKPDNIMVTQGRGGADVVKVVDFGIAKAMSGDEGQKVTKTGLVVGTPEYMSPEQLAGDPLDGRSDIYSLALVFYRLVTGTLPFQADSAQEVMIKRLTDEPMPLNQALAGAEFPARLQTVLNRAMSRMPGDRYDGAAAFADDVMQAVSAMADPAAPVDTEGATQLIAAPGPAVAKTRTAGNRTRTPDTPAVAPRTVVSTPPRKKPVMAIAATVGVLVVGGGAAAVIFNRGGAATGGGPAANPAGAVTPDTALVDPAHNDSRPTGGSQVAGGAATRTIPPPTGSPTTRGSAGGPNPARETRLDSAAIDQELFDMIEPAADTANRATRDAARQKAQTYYYNPAVPTNLRAIAASIVRQTYMSERRVDEACRWNGLALQLTPSNRQYQSFASAASCPR